MSHKTLVNGTVYEVDGGKTLIDGVAYSIDKGKTLVGGTAYEVGFAPPAAKVYFKGSSKTADNMSNELSYVTIDGVNYWTSNSGEVYAGYIKHDKNPIEVPFGTVAELTCKKISGGAGRPTIDIYDKAGNSIYNGTSSYSYVINSDIEITFSVIGSYYDGASGTMVVREL